MSIRLVALAAMVLLAVICIAWLMAPGVRDPFRAIERVVDDVSDSLEGFVEREFEDPRLSPFEEVEWVGRSIQRVKVEGVWYTLLAINGWEIGELLSFIGTKFGAGRVEKRFEEDLPMVLREGGRLEGATVRLEVIGEDGEKRELSVVMTEANRQALWMKRDAALRRGVVGGGAPVAVGSGRRVLENLREVLRTQHSYTVGLGETGALKIIEDVLSGGGELTVAEAARVAALAMGATVDGHAEVTRPEVVEVAPFIQALFMPLDDSVGGVVVAVKPDRSGFLDAERPRVMAVGGVHVEECIGRAGAFVADGSAALARERSCRMLRSASAIGVASPAETGMLLRVARLDGSDSRDVRVDLSSLKPMHGDWPRGKDMVLEENVGYVRLATMADAPKFLEGLRKRLERLKDCRGVVIDVRGNSGGARDALRVLAGMMMPRYAAPLVYNLARPLSGPDLKEADDRMARRYLERVHGPGWNEAERESISRFIQSPAGAVIRSDVREEVMGDWYVSLLSPDVESGWWKPGRRVVVLMDNACFSATDVFLMAMKEMEGVTLVGRPSAGGSGMARAHDLGDGVRVRLSSMMSYQPDGSLLDGVGVKPDVLVWPRAEDFVEGGGDSMLERAVREALGASD